jgi:hypothetical protein
MYDLHKLGWHSFQQLCLEIAREVLGQTVESFLDNNDGGRDGAFSGAWATQSGEDLSGRFVIQCKFTARSDGKLSVSDLSDEVSPAARLVRGGLCDTYILMTNAGITGTSSKAIEQALRSAGVKHTRILSASWLCATIQTNSRLRALVPRVYGLGDLTQILDERAYSQARILLATLKDDLSKVVITSSYRKAADALDQHRFVLLVGEPASGKTTIASLLAMAALDQWKAATLKVSAADGLIAHWNPEAPSQLFWIDDAFGVTQYEVHLACAWNHVLGQMTAILRNGGRIVMTSRDYIYRRARSDLKESAFPLLNESQVVVAVQNSRIANENRFSTITSSSVDSRRNFEHRSNRISIRSRLTLDLCLRPHVALATHR